MFKFAISLCLVLFVSATTASDSKSPKERHDKFVGVTIPGFFEQITKQQNDYLNNSAIVKSMVNDTIKGKSEKMTTFLRDSMKKVQARKEFEQIKKSSTRIQEHHLSILSDICQGLSPLIFGKYEPFLYKTGDDDSHWPSPIKSKSDECFSRLTSQETNCWNVNRFKACQTEVELDAEILRKEHGSDLSLLAEEIFDAVKNSTRICADVTYDLFVKALEHVRDTPTYL